MGCKNCEKDKVKHRKGLWSPEEDQKLREYILKNGFNCWSSVPAKAGLQRNGKSCRLRWINYLRPGLKQGAFSPEEENLVMKLHNLMGNKWSKIALYLPGRTDNVIKNYWNSYLRKKVQNFRQLPPLQISTIKARNENYQTSQKFHDHNIHMSFLEASNTKQVSAESSRHATNISSFEEDPKTALPKLFFAEWLSMDNQKYFSDSRVGGNLQFESTSLYAEANNSELVQLNVSSVGDSVHTFSDEANIYRGLRLQFDSMELVTDNSLYDLLPTGEINNNVTYDL